MVILHYIPSLQKSMGQTAQFAQMLKDVMGKTIETHIISGAVSRHEFVSRLGMINPDIVHLHGCWSIRIAMAQRWAIARGYPVILSPHNGLSPQMLQKDFWKKRLPQILAYQFRTIKKSFVLHASSTQELKDLKELGWKKRIALIPYPDSQSDHQMLCDSFHALYQKVVDTANRNRLHLREHEVLWILLDAAITSKHDTMQVTDTESQHLMQMTSFNWRAIMIYAIDHRIKDIVVRGAEALQFTIPHTITELPPRYSFKPSFHSGAVTTKEQKAAKLFANNPTELSIATDMFVVYRAIKYKELRDNYAAPIEMLCRIAESLRWTDCEEDVLVQILNILGIRTFSARLMQILSETLRLTIGFMPLDPLDDAKTEIIRKKINNLT